MDLTELLMLRAISGAGSNEPLIDISVSGNPVYFYSSAEKPLEKLEVSFSPIWEGSGMPYAPGHGKNLYDIDTYPLADGRYIGGSNGNISSASGCACTRDYIPVSKYAGQTVTLNKRPVGNNPGIAFCAAKCTEQVKKRGVVFIGGKTGGKSSTDVGTYDVEYGKWTFYAATRGNDGVLRLYQGTSDGRLYCIADDMSDIVLDSGLPFYLGQDGTGRYGCTYNGFIDDFALWTRELSHGDVRRIYEAGRNGLSLGDL